MYKCIEKEIKNQISVEVLGYNMMAELSSFTEENNNIMNPFADISMTEISHNSFSSSELRLGSKTVSNFSGRPKVSTNNKKCKDNMSYIYLCQVHLHL